MSTDAPRAVETNREVPPGTFQVIDGEWWACAPSTHPDASYGKWYPCVPVVLKDGLWRVKKEPER